MKFDRRLTDEIYTSDTVRLGKNAFQAMRETVYHNGGVGTITGYYDAELSILSVSDLLLHNLNHCGTDMEYPGQFDLVEWVLFDSHTESVYEAEVTLYYNIRI